MGHTMRAFLASVFLLSAVTCRPDGPGHHHGHHGAHHGAHHADHGAVHHADHGAAHHTAHGAPHHAAHGVHHATHTVGGVVSVAPHTPVHHAPVQHSVHSVVQPVSGHFSVAADPVHHAVHHAEPVHHAVHHADPVHHAVHHADPVHHAVHANTVVKTVAPAVVSSTNLVHTPSSLQQTLLLTRFQLTSSMLCWRTRRSWSQVPAAPTLSSSTRKLPMVLSMPWTPS